MKNTLNYLKFNNLFNIMVLDSLRKKTAIIINEDLKMSKGKTAAQAAHAIAMTESSGKEECIVLKGSVQDIKAISKFADNVETARVHDAGRTEVESGACTALAVYGNKSGVNELTKDLSLL